MKIYILLLSLCTLIPALNNASSNTSLSVSLSDSQEYPINKNPNNNEKYCFPSKNKIKKACNYFHWSTKYIAATGFLTAGSIGTMISLTIVVLNDPSATLETIIPATAMGFIPSGLVGALGGAIGTECYYKCK